MTSSTRARVAAIVGAKYKEKNVSGVYDFDGGGYRPASARVVGGRIRGYDYGTSSHFSGPARNERLNFFDYEHNAHVQLTLKGNKFTGYDYHTNYHFSGSIRGSSVSLYDYDGGGYHNYTV